MNSNISRIKVGGLNELEVHYYSINEVSLIEEGMPGWYSWFYVPDSISDISFNFIKKRKLSVSVKEGFKSGYFGDLVRFYNDVNYEINEDEFFYLQNTLFAFSSPLYVGISKNVNARLSTHVRQLKNHMSTFYNYDDFDADLVSDTDEESSYFAGRISKVMKDESLSTENLYVKVVFSDNEEKLKIIESYLNKMLTPTYGIR